MGLFEDISNWTRSFFERHVVSPIRNVFDAISGGFDFVKTTLWNKISDIGNRIYSMAVETANRVKPFIDTVETAIKGEIIKAQTFINQNILPRITDTMSRLNELRNTVTSKAVEIVNRVKPFIDTAIHQYITPLVNKVQQLTPLLQLHVPLLGTTVIPTLQLMRGDMFGSKLDIINTLRIEFTKKFESYYDEFKTALDGAFSPLTDVLKIFLKLDISDFFRQRQSEVLSIASKNAAMLSSLLRSKSLVAPEDAVLKEKELNEKALGLYFDAVLVQSILEVASLGQFDIAARDIAQSPALDLVIEAWKNTQRMKMQMAYFKPLERFYNRYYTPNIPPVSDLITMVVREAFTPERVTPAPELFVKYMQELGYAKEWSDRYWTAHWALIPLERITEMYHRGIVTEDFYKKYLVLHDYRPDEINYILKWVWRPPNRVEARMMYDLGVLKEEDLDYIARASGIEERFREGWKQMIRGFRVRPLLTKIETIATEAYENGYISNAEYMKLLKEAGFSDIVITWVMKVGQLERRFKLMKLSVDTIVLKFRKGYLTKEEAMRQLTTIGLDTETALHHLAKAEIQALKVSDKAKQAAPKLTVKQLFDAWRKGVIETEELVDALIAKGYTEQEVRILLETEMAKVA